MLLASFLALFSGLMLSRDYWASWFGYEAAYFIHTVVTPLVFVALLYIHSLAAIIFLTKRVKRLNSENSRIFLSSTWTAIFVALTLLYLTQIPIPGQPEQSAMVTSTGIPQPSGQISSDALAMNSSVVTLTLGEVSKHDKAYDCWLVINGRVYDVSAYIQMHPSGPDSVLPYCGKEATDAFNSKGARGKPHSPKAWQLLDRFYVGELGGLASVEKIRSVGTSQAADVRQAILSRFPDAQILKVKMEEDGLYEAKIISEGVLYEVKLTPSGEIVKIEIED